MNPVRSTRNSVRGRESLANSEPRCSGGLLGTTSLRYRRWFHLDDQPPILPMTQEADRYPTPPLSEWPRPLAFVLSGGGAYGSVQVGMMRALMEFGVKPDLIVGSSVGALNGVVLAGSPDTAVEKLTELWSGMSRRVVFGPARGRVIRLFTRRGSLYGFDGLNDLIDSHVPETSFDDLQVRFGAVATDALTGEPEVLSEGALKPSLLASAAVPALFPPVTIDAREYIDGGVTANVPIRQAIAFGARSIVSLDATPPDFATRVPRSLLGRVVHASSLMLRSQRSHAVDELVHRYPIAVLPSSTPVDFGSFNFNRTQQLLETSYATARVAIEAWAAGSLAVPEDDQR